MARDVFNMFWHGRSVSSLEMTCMQSFIRHGHRLRVFTYEEHSLPAGVEHADAREILPYERFFTFMESPSAFTNIFRYKLLFEQGGWWVDSDVLCLKAELPACDYYWAEQHPGVLNGAILKFPPSDPMCGRLLEQAEERREHLTHWGQLGPLLIKKVLRDYRPVGYAGSTEDAYPLHFLETHFFWLPEFASVVRSRTKDSTFLHFWHSTFADLGIDVERAPPKGSYLDALYAEYGTSPPPASRGTVDRDSIIQYVQQEYVEELWRDKLHRSMDDLGMTEMLARKAAG